MMGLDDADELVDLLDEFLLASEEGPVDLEDFERRAGARADQFLRCVELSGEVRGLSSFLTPPEEHSFGRFVQRRTLGAGGHSTVHLAWDTELEREVALKVLALPGSRESSLSEARSLARLEHPGVVRVFEVGELQERAYLAMEFVEGVSLRDAIEALRGAGGEPGLVHRTQESRDHVVAIALQSTAARCLLVARLARALAYCHGAGVVHRDLKPENVLTDETLRPKLIDFGLAREQVSEDGETSLGLRGTPSYFSPEQVDHEVTGASAASDQFSLGVLLYELLTLRHPFRGGSMAETLMSISRAAPTPLRRVRNDLPPDVELICAKSLEKDPSRRYSSVEGLADDLEAFVDHRAISLRPASLGKQLLREGLRHRRKLVGAALLAALVCSLLLAADFRRVHSDSMELTRGITLAQERLQGLREPEQYEQAFRFLANSWRSAEQLDGSKWNGFLTTSARSQLQTQWAATRERFLLELTGSSRSFDPIENSEAASKVLKRWGDVLYWLRYSLARDDDASDQGVFGSLLLPDDYAVHEYSHLPDRPILENLGRPQILSKSGQYRLVQGGDRERDVVLRTGELNWGPELRLLDERVRGSMLPIPGGVLPPDEKTMTRKSYVYSPFSVTSEPVSWNQLRGVLTGKEWDRIAFHQEGLPPELLGDDLPALVPWVFAQECAVRLGARLPTAAELLVVFQGEHVPLPSLKGEWTSLYQPVDSSRRYWRACSVSPGENRRSARFGLEKLHESAWTDAIGFRLATSLALEDPDR